jgi:hypothetical protein
MLINLLFNSDPIHLHIVFQQVVSSLCAPLRIHGIVDDEVEWVLIIKGPVHLSDTIVGYRIFSNSLAIVVESDVRVAPFDAEHMPLIHSFKCLVGKVGERVPRVMLLKAKVLLVRVVPGYGPFWVPIF